MYAFHGNCSRNLSVIIHDQWCGSWKGNFVKVGGKIDKFADCFLLAAKLNQIDPAIDHRFGNASAIVDVDVTEINYAVETAIA